jgi:hypothetical protein
MELVQQPIGSSIGALRDKDRFYAQTCAQRLFEQLRPLDAHQAAGAALERLSPASRRS